MSIITTEFDEKPLERKKVTDLRLITGGKDGDGFNGSWLVGLPIGSIFLVQESGRDPQFPSFLLMQYYLNYISPSSRSVMLITGADRKQEVFVDPVRFCNRFRLHEVLFNPEVDKPHEIEEDLVEEEQEDTTPSEKEEETQG